MGGWIKLHRKLCKWEWYDDHNTTRLFIHLLLKAQHEDSQYRGVDIKKGSMKTGRIQLASETGLSQQQVRTSLKKLISTNEITIKTTNKYSIIAVNNWCDHQIDNQQNTQQVTNNQPTNNQQVTTCKNDKKEKNGKTKIDLIAFAQGLVPDSDLERKELIKEWLEYKVEIKKPVKSERGIKAMVTMWSKYTNDQIRALADNSMSNNYQGMCWDKAPEQKKRTGWFTDEE